MFDLNQIIVETRFEPQSGILYMGNGEMVDVARNMVTTNEYPTEERPTKPIVDKTHFQMMENCKLLANNILSISSLLFTMDLSDFWFSARYLYSYLQQVME